MWFHLWTDQNLFYPGPKVISPHPELISPGDIFFTPNQNFGVDTDFTSIQKIAPGRLFHLIKNVHPNQILFHLYPELISPRQNDSDGIKISNWILTLVHTLPELGTLHCAAIWVFVTIVVLENKSDSRWAPGIPMQKHKVHVHFRLVSICNFLHDLKLIII